MSLGKHDIKLYQINTNFYEYQHISTLEDKILFIVDRHREATQNNGQLGRSLPEEIKGEVKYLIYTFNIYERDSTWKGFLPDSIINEEDFRVQSISFVLFAIIENRVFAFIGGNGIFVIKRFLNQTFGLDLFEKIADPTNDVVVTISSRGISGNLSSQTSTFRNEQKLIDSLDFSRIPNSMTLQLRDTIITDVFDFLEADENDKIYLNLSSSFHLKQKLTFDQTHELVVRANEILNSEGLTPLSNFVQIKENSTKNNLRLQLYDEIRDDMIRAMQPNSNRYGKRLDIDFLHPSRPTDFYECENYALFARGARNPFYVTNDRKSLYLSCLNYAFNNIEHSNLFEFGKFISGVRCYGYKDNERLINAMFTQHITCEIEYNNKPVFQIDSRWYTVKGNFVENINELCSTLIEAYYLNEVPNILTWPSEITDEGDYNLQFANDENYIVLDKALGDNIELCDLIYETDEKIYLIHVKKGFDAKIRDLSNQISISSNRLWTDLKSGSFDFIDQVYRSFAQKEHFIESEWSRDRFRELFSKEITYVMAFNSTLSNGRTVRGNISNIRSNIAKFSLIQSVRDMANNQYQMGIIEIQNS